MRAAALVSAAVLLALAAVQTTVGARSASRVIDRTLLCTTQPSGGVYEIEARGHSGTRAPDSTWLKLPSGVVASGRIVGGVGQTFLDNSFAWITAGRPTSSTTLGHEFEITPVLPNGTLALNRKHCRTVSARIALASAGLTGGAEGQLGESIDCAAPQRVLVRVRAVLALPGTLRGRGDFVRTTTPVREAKLAARTLSGKPLVYAEVLESGKARLFTAPNCIPD
jgi:hypothetical protein